MAEDDDDQQLFRRALESMTAADVFRGKYGKTPTQKDQDDQSPESDSSESVSREELARLREVREMEDAFAGIEPIERGKYHRRTPAEEPLKGDDFGAADAEFAAAMSDEPANPEPEPVELPLAEQAPDDTPSKNLRGLSPDEALRQLGLFIDLASKDGHDFVQLKIGSNPDLLKAVTEWLKGPGSVYINEFQPVETHADAAIFARIRRQLHS